MFSNFNMIWPRWSAYEVRTWHGVNYLMPVPGAEAIPYNCAQQAEKLVSNALELGRQVFLKADGLECLCTEFAARHGLLGLDKKTQDSSKRVLRLPATVRSVNSNTVRCWNGSKKSYWDCIGIFSAPVASFSARV